MCGSPDRIDSLRSPFGRTACVCRRYAPRSEPAITRLKASWLNHSPTGPIERGYPTNVAGSKRLAVWRCGSGLNRHLPDRQSGALPLSYRSGEGRRPRGGHLPSVVRPPATRRRARTSAARRYPASLHTRAWLRSSHNMHYPLPLATDDAGDPHRFAAIPDVSRTRETGLAWSDRAWARRNALLRSFAAVADG